MGHAFVSSAKSAARMEEQPTAACICTSSTSKLKNHLYIDTDEMEEVMVKSLETYKYFMSTSTDSAPPSDLYIRPSIGDISDCLIDWRISTTVAKWTSYTERYQS